MLGLDALEILNVQLYNFVLNNMWCFFHCNVTKFYSYLCTVVLTAVFIIMFHSDYHMLWVSFTISLVKAL
jgi:hypothetical protein